MNVSETLGIRQAFASPHQFLPWIAFTFYLSCIVCSILFFPAFTPVVIVGLFGLFATLWEPFVGILIMTCLAMVGDLQHFGDFLSPAKIVFLLTLLSFAAKAAARRGISIVKSGLEFPLLLFFGFYIFGVILNLLANSTGRQGITGFGDIITMLGYPAGFILFLNLLTTERRIKYVLMALIIGALVTSVASALQQFADFNVLTSVTGTEQIEASNGLEGMRRISSLMKDPNATAYPLILALPVVVLMAINSKRRLAKAILYVVGCICLYGLVVTFSRSGYLAVFASFLLLPFFQRAARLIKAYAVVAALVLAIPAFIPSGFVLGRFGQIQEERGGESDRSLYYVTAASLIVEHPVVPAGEAQFMSAIAQRTGIEQIPHSNMLAAGVNGGLLGFSAFIWLLFVYARSVTRGIRSIGSASLRNYAVGAFLGEIGLQVQGLFIMNIGWSLMWAFAAVPFCCILLDRKESKQTKNGNRLMVSANVT